MTRILVAAETEEGADRYAAALMLKHRILQIGELKTLFEEQEAPSLSTESIVDFFGQVEEGLKSEIKAFDDIVVSVQVVDGGEDGDTEEADAGV